mmetsp:Transcript_27891/g.61534  ORF Transcript_27891/g.61534 Transcript_27891/m.61534 type:complete len:249 (+) Transcript_27891:2160-2906(+)
MYTIRSSLGFRREKLSSTQTFPASDFFRKPSIEVPRVFPASTTCRISSSKFHIHLHAIFWTPASHSAKPLVGLKDDGADDGFFPNPFPGPPSFGDAATPGVPRMIMSPSQTPLVTSRRLISYGDRSCVSFSFAPDMLFSNASKREACAGTEYDDSSSPSSLSSMSSTCGGGEFLDVSDDGPWFMLAAILSTKRFTSFSISIMSLMVSTLSLFFPSFEAALPARGAAPSVSSTLFSSATTTRKSESSSP